MSVTAPPRPPRPSDPVDRDELEALVEALIEEARQRARRRRRRRGAIAILVGLIGATLFAVLDRAALSESSSPAFSARTGLGAAASSRMAFTQSRAGGQGSGALYVVNPDGSGRRRLAEVAHHRAPSWSPGGRQLTFLGTDGIKVVNADGSGLQKLAPGGQPTWSPDGQRIAFVYEIGQDARGSGLYLIDADGSGQRRLVRTGAMEPRWSPNGRTIAFVRRQTPPSFDFDIYLVDADGGPARNLTPTPAYENDPDWSPDGRRIAFVRGYDIWLMNADGSGQRRLTSGAARDRLPSWSPDGRTIVFDRRLGNRGSAVLGGKASSVDIYVMNADGSGLRRLARNGAAPLWPRDGKRIAFSRPLGNGVGGFGFTLGNWEIFVMNADGTDQRNVSRNRRWDDCCFPWSPGQK